MKFISLLFILILLTGCSSLVPKGRPAPSLYTLSTPLNAPADSVHIPLSLRILMPQAAPGLETERIALRKTDNQIDYFQDAKWSGTLTALVQSQLVQSFDNAARLNSVSNDLIAVNQDYSLLVEIQDFQIIYQKGPVAQLRLTTKLIEMDTNKIIMTTTYQETQAAQADTLQQVVKAMDVAYQRLSSRLVNDVLQSLSKKATSRQLKK